MDRTASAEPCPASPPLRVLSLDGGGIRGLSSLLILEHIMEEVRRVKSLDQIPKPCEYFDLIGGTSTGGIIAILLGRLSMTVDDCIRAYKKVAQQAFTPKRTTILPASPSGSFSATQLESVIKQTIREYCIDPQCVAQRKQGKQTINTCSHEEMHFRDRSCTKTVVLAITKDNVDAPPTLFTTYDTSTSLHGCTIWQVARATSAATTFFKPIHVGRDDIEFIDAGFGYNNPCEVLIAEAEKQFPDRKQMQILSIGTGLGDICAINSKRRSILKALTKMATTSKKVASRLDRKYSDRGIYYRFDVDRGLEDVTLSDWDKTSNISAHTRNYLEENERIIKKFVEAFTGAVPVESGLRVTQESGRTGRRVVHHIPFKKNKHFVERTDAIDTLRRLLFTQPETQQVALVGLGGIGKTQVALHLAHWVKDNYSEYSVLWVPALSMASFEQACTELVKQLNIQRRENEDTKELVRQHLSLKSAGSWLLIIDNIDDIDLFDGPRQRRDGIFDYLPESDGGRILFTTRSQEVAVAAAGSAIVRLREMAQEEAIGFLKKSLISKDQLQDDKVVAKLLGKLNYIPLAIAQAAAYMNVNQIPITEYLGLLEKKDKDAIEALSTKLRDRTHYHDSQSAVMTTWMISFDQIREKSITAARLLSFIAHLEPKAIPQSLLPKLETEQQMTYAIGIMRNYGFLDRRADNETFDMHSLVHLTIRIWSEGQENAYTTRREVLKCLTDEFPSDKWENREIWQRYLPHALRLLRSEKGFSDADCRLAYLVGRCLRREGQIKEAIKLLREVVAIDKKTLAETHPDRLASQHGLAGAYQANGQIKEAVKLLQHVVAMKKRISVETHPSLLASE